MLSPLADLYADKSSMPIMSYPKDLGSSRKGHYIAFTISKNVKSRFEGHTEVSSSAVSSAFSPITDAIKQGETALNNVSSAVNTVTGVVNDVSSAINAGLSTFNTVVGSVAGIAGSVGGISQMASSSLASGSITGALQTGITAVSVAGNVLGSASSLANQADALVGSVGNFLSDPMGAVSDAYDSLTNALGNADKISLSSLFEGEKNNPIFSPQTLKPVGYINLYTPDTINMSQTATYQDLKKTEALGAAGVGKEMIDRVPSYVDTFKNQGLGGVVSKAVTDPMAAEFGGNFLTEEKLTGKGMSEYLLAQGGYAVNPQLEVIFSRMEFRTFQFTFHFTPKSKAEAKTVRDIIQQFRIHAAPQIDDQEGGGRYFIAPSVFNIEYMFSNTNTGQSGRNENLHKFAPCVLRSIVVDYSQEVGWVTHDDGMPVKTLLVLEFQEMEILTKERIQQGY